MPQLPEWPALDARVIDLWLRDPRRRNVEGGAWGTLTEALLGDTLAVKAEITLEVKWLVDWRRFERECVNTGGWRRVIIEEVVFLTGEDGVIGAIYCLCGRKMRVGGTKETC